MDRRITRYREYQDASETGKRSAIRESDASETGKRSAIRESDASEIGKRSAIRESDASETGKRSAILWEERRRAFAALQDLRPRKAGHMRLHATIVILLLVSILGFSTQVLATTYFVNPDGTGDFPTVQAAVDAAIDGDEIRLGDGVFTGPGNRDIQVPGIALTIRSDSFHPETCIIDCEGSEAEPHRGFVFLTGESPWASLLGITITHGHAGAGDPYGGGILCGESTSPWIENCIIRVNHASIGGGVMGEDFSAPRFENCILMGNSATAGSAMAFRNTCTVVVGGCTVQNNHASWGGALLYGGWTEERQPGGDLEIARAGTSGNRPHATRWESEPTAPLSRLTVKLSVFRQNTVTDQGPGGGIYYDGRPDSWMEIGIAAFVGHGGGSEVDDAGAIYFRGFSDYPSHIMFVTFARNDAGGMGTAGSCIRHDGGSLDISACVMAMNEASAVACVGGDASELSVSCCDIFANRTGDWVDCLADWYGVEGNFGADPRFCDPEFWDFKVDALSPCLPDNNECGYMIGGMGPGCTIPFNTYVVSPDGTADFPTIQAAIDAANDYDIIELTDGVFTGSGNRDLSLRGKRIVVRSQSGDPTTCVIDCEGSAADPHRAFLFESGETPSSLIENLTLTGGHVTGDTIGGIGGAIYCDAGSPSIHGCVIHTNRAVAGGGIALRDSYAIIENCTIASNRIDSRAPVGAGLVCESSGAEIRRTIIADNAGGPGVSRLGACPVLSCIDIFGNEGGDWVDSCLAGQLAIRGNFSKDPLFCDPEGNHFDLAKQSPCLPSLNGCGVLIGALGIGCVTPAGLDDDTMIGARVSLECNAPNPFHPMTELRFDLRADAVIELHVFDVTGRRVRTLIDAASYSAGSHRVVWDGKDDYGESVAAGVYAVRLRAGDEVRTGKLTLAR